MPRLQHGQRRKVLLVELPHLFGMTDHDLLVALATDAFNVDVVLIRIRPASLTNTLVLVSDDVYEHITYKLYGE